MNCFHKSSAASLGTPRPVALRGTQLSDCANSSSPRRAASTEAGASGPTATTLKRWHAPNVYAQRGRQTNQAAALQEVPTASSGIQTPIPGRRGRRLLREPPPGDRDRAYQARGGGLLPYLLPRRQGNASLARPLVAPHPPCTRLKKDIQPTVVQRSTKCHQQSPPNVTAAA